MDTELVEFVCVLLDLFPPFRHFWPFAELLNIIRVFVIQIVVHVGVAGRAWEGLGERGSVGI